LKQVFVSLRLDDNSRAFIRLACIISMHPQLALVVDVEHYLSLMRYRLGQLGLLAAQVWTEGVLSPTERSCSHELA